MNWRLALKKRWLELFAAAVWMVSAVVDAIYGYLTTDLEYWLMFGCAIICATLWILIFYKRAKRDGA